MNPAKVSLFSISSSHPSTLCSLFSKERFAEVSDTTMMLWKTTAGNKK